MPTPLVQTPAFQSTPPARGATRNSILSLLFPNLFQSTPPARGATLPLGRRGVQVWISIHAPREGGDVVLNFVEADLRRFQSTPPARGATRRSGDLPARRPISIHAPREGGDDGTSTSKGDKSISIHAPREGGDNNASKQLFSNVHFNPRPPRGGRLLDPHLLHLHSYFNPRPPRGGRRKTIARLEQTLAISIHAPREGGDHRHRLRGVLPGDISIHAPREGGDNGTSSLPKFESISIHAPREGGDYTPRWCTCTLQQFQSTPPARGATAIRYTFGS